MQISNGYRLEASNSRDWSACELDSFKLHAFERSPETTRPGDQVGTWLIFLRMRFRWTGLGEFHELHLRPVNSQSAFTPLSQVRSVGMQCLQSYVRLADASKALWERCCSRHFTNTARLRNLAGANVEPLREL
ncbi:hypothetical protein [Paucibacter sp. DJ2R-2]|uniref:hypothetical protein n=1 Tax=Paucibacter sp. DJ2R-2 TaxID=2893558 RepID=UPI0021E47A7F|nr:hypothetical protein [Paucibacter sp. DJ2R-2]